MSFDRLLKYWAYQFFSPETVLKEKYRAFRKILQADRQAHLHMARLEEIFYNRQQVDCSRVDLIYQDLSNAVSEMVSGLLELSPGKYGNLKDYFKKIDFYCKLLLAPMNFNTAPPYVFHGGEAKGDENLLGGKGFNLNILKERLGLPVPDFFIITTHSFYFSWNFMELSKR
jgi:pyruvate,water dikinase